MKNGKKSPPMEVFNVKLPVAVLNRLRKQAVKEDRTVAYLVRVALSCFLDDRNRAGGVRTNA
jgi:hypothetical protein